MHSFSYQRIKNPTLHECFFIVQNLLVMTSRGAEVNNGVSPRSSNLWLIRFYLVYIYIVCIVLINMLCTSIPLPGRIYNTSIWCILWCSFADFFPILQDSPIPSNPRWATKASPRCIAEPPRPGCQQNSAAFALCRESRVEIWWSQRSQTTSHLTRNVFKIFFSLYIFSCLEKLLQSDFYPLKSRSWRSSAEFQDQRPYIQIYTDYSGQVMKWRMASHTKQYYILYKAMLQTGRPKILEAIVEFAWICE